MEFDEQSGRLRLDREAFDRLTSVAGGAAGDEDTARALRHPKVKAGVDSVLNPVCELRITMASAESVVEHHGWVTPQAAALLLVSADGMFDFLTLEPQFVPGALARMVRLGPRKVGSREAVAVDEQILIRLLDAEASIRAAALASLAGAQASLAYRVEVTWPTPEGESAQRGLMAVDGVSGIYVLEPAGGSATFEPSSATVVWTAFCSLLPEDHALAGWLDTGGASAQPDPMPAA